jgi:hypothetical protein
MRESPSVRFCSVIRTAPQEAIAARVNDADDVAGRIGDEHVVGIASPPWDDDVHLGFLPRGLLAKVHRLATITGSHCLSA